jgi:2-isopropylmalate synthase
VNISDLIYDWNALYPKSLHPPGPVRLTDETLRDGLQSPSVRDPSIDQKLEILHLMEALGINTLDLGLPGAGPRAVEHVTALAREIVAHKLKITAYCAARTVENDILPIAEIVQKTGLPIEVAAFIGSAATPRAGPATSFFERPKRPSDTRSRLASKSCTSRKTPPAAIRKR